MDLRLLKLEKRLLFDASVVAAVVSSIQVSDSSHGTNTGTEAVNHNDGSDPNHSSTDIHPSTDNGDTASRDAQGKDNEHVISTGANPSSSVDILVVSNLIPNMQTLVNSAAEGTKVVVYNSSTDSLDTILSKIESAADGHSVGSIAFVNHGESGRFFLTNKVIVSDNSLQHDSALRSFWSKVGQLVESGGNIDLLSCNLVQNDTTIINTLDNIVDSPGHDVLVSAATGIVGNSEGGSWILNTGVNASTLFDANLLSQWTGSLSTFTVTNTSDNILTSGSLPFEIAAANAAGAGSLIDFAIPGSGVHTINITSALPTITTGITINGYSQSGSVAHSGTSLAATIDIVLNGGGGNYNGLNIVASGVTIEGLSIQNFGKSGISVSGSNDIITGNYIGTNVGGTSSTGTGNGSHGIDIISGSNDSITYNLISGNAGSGINLSSGVSSTIIQSNYIGVNITASSSLANSSYGISMSGTSDVTIGGTGSGQSNVISGNSAGGIFSSSDTNVDILGNYIGTNATGLSAIGNGGDGIKLSGDSNDIIGGSTTAARNIISGNTGNGIEIIGGSFNHVSGNYIGVDSTGSNPLSNSLNGVSLSGGTTGNDIGVSLYGGGNVISGNTKEGIYTYNDVSNTIAGNWIGTNAAGTGAVNNGDDGIQLNNSTGDIIGGSAIVDSNIISGNTNNGVEIIGGSGNHVSGNYIGVDSTGNSILANGKSGVSLSGGTSANYIGFSSNGGGNVISGNTNAGIYSNGDSGNIIAGNYIGTNSSGSLLQNGWDGIQLNNSTGDVIGGSTSTARNIISGNVDNGVSIIGGSSNNVSGNYIGIDPTGTIALANGINGVSLSGNTTGNYIGNSAFGGGNVISGNTTNGVEIVGGSSNNISGNYIGVDASGNTALANGTNGISLSSNATGNYIGTSAFGGGNVISGNTNEGIYASGDTSNTIAGNYIGTNAAGTGAIKNGDDGIQLNNSTGDIIGGSTVADRNIISGNTNNGIEIIGGSAIDVSGNYIGVDSTGNTALANGLNGVLLSGGTTGDKIGTSAFGGGNVISGNTKDGILATNDSSNIIAGNFIGTNAAGTNILSNGQHGVELSNSTNDTIGGSTVADRNIISGNTNNGVYIGNNSTSVTLSGNNIGIDSSGNTALANGFNGIEINSGSSIQIGVATDPNPNVVSGNTLNGILLDSGASNITIVNNYIGTNATGASAVGNNLDGIAIVAASQIAIGGTASGDKNVISGNKNNGINIQANSSSVTVEGNYIGIDASGSSAVGNLFDGVLLQSTATIGTGNVISANGKNGIEVASSVNNAIIIGNYIGTDALGTSPLGNTLNGILAGVVSGLRIGGTVAADRNVISGNTQDGIEFSNTTNSIIEGNYIGVDATGTVAVANGKNGVDLEGAVSNTIGGIVSGSGNVISGNISNGILLAFNSNNNSIYGNYIGTSSDGLNAIGNANGIFIRNTSDSNTIGNTLTSGFNVISGNTGDGININTSSSGTNIHGNIIGLTYDGEGALGNGGNGIIVDNTNNTTIGGTSTGQGNIISANTGNGITIQNGSASTNIQANYIGTDLLGVSGFGNQKNGVSIDNSISVTVGGDAASQKNIISGNVLNGILISNIAEAPSTQTTPNDTIIGNVIGLNVNDNILGNSVDGISIVNSNNILIGDGTVGGRNIISGNGIAGNNTVGGNGIYFTQDSSSSNVYNNYIGLDSTGSFARGNVNNGVFFDTVIGSGNAIGDNIAANHGNVISGNGGNGIASLSTSNEQLIIANIIGLNASGTGIVANGNDGIFLENSNNFRIGSDMTGAAPDRNYISGNVNSGINITGGGDHIITDNYIGTNITGTGAFANGGSGIVIDNSSGNSVGRTSAASTFLAGELNLISGNNLNGVSIINGSQNNAIMNNYIGTTVSGLSQLANQQNGVEISSSINNIIGDTSGNSINVISGNSQNGILIHDVNSQAGSGNIIIGNYIGVGKNGTTVVSNAQSGVFADGSTGDLIGQAGSAINVISGNGRYGVALTNGANNYSVTNNYIGTDVTGLVAIGNGLSASGTYAGVYINDGSSNFIGGSTSNARNIISGNTYDGVQIDGNSFNNTIEGNYIGLTKDGTAGLANQGNGISILNGTNNNIGESNGFSSNIISGNTGSGILVSGGSDTLIQSNIIGLDASGSNIIANLEQGVLVNGTAVDTFVGVSGSNQQNVISGNGANGVEVSGNATGTSILNDYIGTDATGTIAKGNQLNGIFIDNVSGTSSSPTIIGDTTHNNLTVISGNVQNGIYISGGSFHTVDNAYIGVDVSGEHALGNGADGVFVENTSNTSIGNGSVGVNNVISNNSSFGVEISNSINGSIRGNIIGLDAQGNTIMGNGSSGVILENNTSNFFIGAVATGPSNIISGNADNGIVVNTGSTHNTIINNYIGLASDGAAALGNQKQGILFDGVAGNTIGGTSSGVENTISGNGQNGILLNNGANNNNIIANFIGTDHAGTFAVGNTFNGIQLDNASNNTIGSAVALVPSLISGNGQNGISLINGSSNNTITANFIGLNFTGSNSIGNTLAGIEIDGATSTSNIIGGTVLNSANIISSNGTYGIYLHNGASLTTVEGNYIGTDETGTVALGNHQAGIYLDQAVSTTIGGTTPGLGNLISGNGSSTSIADGIDVTNNSTNTIIAENIIGLKASGNATLANTGNGIFVDHVSGVQIGLIGANNVISGNGENGILLTSTADQVSIVNNLIGTDITGMLDQGNSLDGIYVNGATNTTIGGTVAGSANIISGNTENGIHISAGNNTEVFGNYIGLKKNGTASLGNTLDGIFLDGANGAIIGGTTAAQRNIISGNVENGVEVGSNVTNSSLTGNYIGTDYTGTVNVGNTLNGVLLTGASGFTVGGSAAGDGNLISGNKVNGIFIDSASSGNFILQNNIGTNSTGNSALPNIADGILIDGSGNTVGGTTVGDRNIISGNTGNGIEIRSASNNNILGNYIGTNIAGTSAVGNTLNGVYINAGASTNDINNNVISGNIQNGIALDTAANGNIITGNLIGVNASGAAAISNTLDGIFLDAATNTIIGGTTAAERNIISGNLKNGVDITDASTGTSVKGNYIGTDIGGTSAVGNGLDGVAVTGTSNTTIGGSSAGEGNIISANKNNGIHISLASNQTTILGNYIGTDYTGTLALGNLLDGVFSNLSNNTTVGGTSAGDGNIISANIHNGIHFSGGSGGLIEGNIIGLNVSEAVLGNKIDGILFDAGVTNSVIGGSAAGSNTISGNIANGVAITQNSSGNSVAYNKIGTDSTGILARGNTVDGILVDSSNSNNIANNIISANQVNGIALVNTTTLTSVTNNLIGVDATGIAGLGNLVDGIFLSNAPGNTIGGVGVGNTISSNLGNGVDVTNGSSSVSIVGNYIGKDATGSVHLGNTLEGILVSSSNTPSIASNLIEFNNDNGLKLVASTGASVSSNIISGNIKDGIDITNHSNNAIIESNKIGTDPTGNIALANGFDGIRVDNSTGTLIGTATTGTGNTISGNTKNGIELSNGSNNTSILNNMIGVNSSGTSALANGIDGILATGVNNTVVGASGSGNIISANIGNGIHFTGGGTGDSIVNNIIGLNISGAALGNGTDGILFDGGVTGATIGSVADVNTISGNVANGIALTQGSSGNTIIHNYIGTGLTGLAGVGAGNTMNGILVDNSNGNSIVNNIISENGFNGISLANASTLNSITSNLIGVDAANGALGNTLDGILLNNAPNTIIGGIGVGNTISSNGRNGIDVTNGSTGVTISNNYIGTNAAGTLDLGNTLDGVLVNNSNNASISGNLVYYNDSNGLEFTASTGASVVSNTISRNDVNGISITNQSNNISIKNNKIGTDPTGSAAFANGNDGIYVNNSTGTAIGTATAGTGNTISANTTNGIELVNGANNTTILNNLIGLNSTGTAGLGNGADGILAIGVNNINIGSITAGNFISGNVDNGVHITGGGAGDSIVNNIIGLDVTGNALGNLVNGVLFDGGVTGATIGGAVVADRNIISSNGTNGVAITQSSHDNTVQNNYIGTDATGLISRGNTADGILINASNSNTILNNVISANNSYGVEINNGSSLNILKSNLIGVNATGNVALGNIADGVLLDNAPNTIIGAVGAGNNISANGVNGIDVTNGSVGVSIEGNYIGTNSAGTALLGNSAEGVLINSSNQSTIKNNLIVDNGDNGIVFNNVDTSLVAGNDIGIDSTNLLGMGNKNDGIYVNNSSNITIGGTIAALRNVISENVYNGVEIINSVNTTLEGNYIGTDVTGTASFGNGFDGVLVNNSPNMTIGGTAAGAGNVISGNALNGIELYNGSNNISIFGNIIGLNASGTAVLGNNKDGVFVNDVNGISVGGTASGARNIISGNNVNGVDLFSSVGSSVLGNIIGADITGSFALANVGNGVYVDNSLNSTIGGTTAAARNIISGNLGDGIEINNGVGTTIEGNYIGINAAGTQALGNALDGVFITNTSNITVGGIANGAGNVISSNGINGIEISNNSNNVSVLGNIIGLNAAGSVSLGNTNDGVFVNGVNNAVIGGTIAGARNVISGNGANGVDILSSTGSSVVGNMIGTDTAGSTALGNSIDGVHVNGSYNTIIGGTSAADRNIISGNGNDGVALINTSNVTLEGNYIGTNAAGTASISNNADGVYVDNSPNIIIGGIAAGAGNLISGNKDNGIQLANGSDDVSILGNMIGLNASGLGAIGNTLDGVYVNGVNNITIGGAVIGAANTISGNGQNGVDIFLSAGSAIIGNMIGVNILDTGPVGNGVDGVRINSSLNTTIGGTIAADRNIISGNTANGISIINTSNGITIESNVIGTNAAATAAISNGADGIYIDNSSEITIGDIGDGNIISGNKHNGIELANGAANIFIGNNIIGLNGTGTASLGNTFDGILARNANNVTIGGTVPGKANIISGNLQNGIHFVGGSSSAVIGNEIGTNSTGSISLSNGADGVLIDGSSNISIGGTSSAARNIVSGNKLNGIALVNGADSIIVEGNLIGSDSTGNVALGNILNGVFVNASTNDRITNNVISGNQANGIEIANGSAGTTVTGNKIGVNISGAGALANTLDGVLTLNANGATIGGSVASDGNIISGNSQNGVHLVSSNNMTVQGNEIGTDVTGLVAIGNTMNGVLLSATSNSLIGGTILLERNVISGNNANGVSITNLSVNNTVQGNYIGVDATGNAKLSNALDGVYVNNSSGSIIEANLISGNTQNGIELVHGNNTSVLSNMIGVNASGASALSNTLDGVSVTTSNNVTIGGVGEGNVISGNKNGVEVVSSTSFKLFGNKIGTDVTGLTKIANNHDGVLLSGVSNSILGGSNAGQGNLISGNKNNGIEINNSITTSIKGNLIGTDITGNAKLSNLFNGIALNASNHITIGGTAAGAGNVISGNFEGIVFSNTSDYNFVYGNNIGVGLDGVTAIPNTFDGIDIKSGNNIEIGGFNPGEANIIAYNQRNGIGVVLGIGNAFLNNSIHDNGLLGIDLGNTGVTYVDQYYQNSNGDTGPNNYQNYPIILSAHSYSSGVTNITGMIYGQPFTTLVIQVFSNPTVDNTGSGEGANVVTTFNVTMNANGVGTFGINIATPAQNVLAATATSSLSGTSNFSGDAIITAASGIPPADGGAPDIGGVPFTFPNTSPMTFFNMSTAGPYTLNPVYGTVEFMQRFIDLGTPQGFLGINGNNQMSSDGALGGFAGLASWEDTSSSLLITKEIGNFYKFSSTEVDTVKEALDAASSYLDIPRHETIINQTILDFTRVGHPAPEGELSPIDQNLAITGTD